MLNELRQNWQITSKNQPQPLKAEAPASGETLQRLRGAAAAKKQNGFNRRVLRRYFSANDQLHHRDIENATEAAQRAKNDIFWRDNTGGYFSISINRKYLLYYKQNLLIVQLLINFILFCFKYMI